MNITRNLKISEYRNEVIIMPKTSKNEPLAWKKKYESQEKYDASHTKRYAFKLNLETDKDIIDALDTCGNKQGLLKEAIRFYLANGGGK